VTLYAIFISLQQRADEERELYVSCVAASRDGARTDPHTSVHYTFDFAQNVNLPNHARQMGPLYFLSLKAGSHYERLFQRWPAFEKSNK